MAWNYGNKTFTVQWKSFNNITCRVDIYIRGSQIPTPLSLKPAVRPFTYEEDNDNDLLNNTIRYKTGYLRIVEVDNQDISSLYPTDDHSHYVEFYYGNRLDFIGYLQSQDFSNTIESTPREVEFAVASPLWVLSKRTFNFDGGSKNPQFVTIGSLLDEIIAWDGGLYTDVIFPYFSDIKLDNTIWSQTFAPWNEEYNHIQASTQVNPVYETKTFEWFLDALCKAFGWVLHDDVKSLTFSMFDYTGRYAKYPVGHIGDTDYLDISSGPQGGVSTAIADSFEFCDDAASQNIIMPYSRIRVNYEGEYRDTGELSYLRTLSFGFENSDDVIRAVGLQPRIQQREIYPPGTGISFDSSRKVATQGVHVCVFNSQNSPSKQLGICYAIKGNENDGDILFTIRHYTPFSTADWRVKCKVSSGATLNDLSEDDTTHRFGNIAHNVYRQYNGYVECDFIVRQVSNSAPMGIPANAWSVRDAIFFSDIEWYTESEETFAEYTQLTKGYDDITGPRTTFEDGELTMPLHMYRLNDHMIGNTVRATMVTEYPYLLNVRNEVIARFKVSTIPDHLWCTLWQYLRNNWRWRIIAYAFDPYNDEMQLTIEQSTTLE